MKIYLASRYSRLSELKIYANRLEVLGHYVTSRWLNGTHQLHPNADKIDKITEQVPIEAKPFAQDDVADVQRADMLVLFTESPNSPVNRGGRHVEFGIALALHKRIVIVGPRENVFHCLSEVTQYLSFDAFIKYELS